MDHLTKFFPKLNSGPVDGGATRLLLYCFPYAGGDIAIFKHWPKQLPSWIEICPIRLPGRGSRISDPPVNEIPALACDIADAITRASTIPFCLFGHSMGALLAFEVTRSLRTRSSVMPLKLFASACPAPHIRVTQRPTVNMTDAEFLAEIKSLNGTPRAFFDDPILVSLLLPMLRADFHACETYRYESGQALPVDISVFGGEGDSDVTAQHLNAWSEVTSGTFSMDMFPGDHFFLHSYETELVANIVSQIRAVVPGATENARIRLPS